MAKYRLSDISVINPKDKIDDLTMDVSFVPMQCVSEHGDIDVSDIRTASEVSKGFTTFVDGDVLMAKITPCMENGKGAVARDLCNNRGFGSTEFFVIRPNQSVVRSQWIYYYTAQKRFRLDCEKNMTGSAGQKRVPRSYLEKCEIEVPSLDEQDSILSQLNHLRAIINMRQRQIRMLGELVSARFVEMFGDPVSNPLDLDMIPLGERCEIVTGNTPSRAEPENYGHYIEWIKSDNINTPYTYVTKAQEFLSEIGYRKCRFVDSGSLLMTCIAGSISCIGQIGELHLINKSTPLFRNKTRCCIFIGLCSYQSP